MFLLMLGTISYATPQTAKEKKDYQKVIEALTSNRSVADLKKLNLNMMVLNANGETLLHYGIKANQIKGVDLKFINRVLEVASSKDKKELLSFRDKQGKTALELSFQRGKNKFPALLLEHGVDPNTKDAKGEYLFHIVARQEKYHLLRLFLELKIDINKVDSKGDTLFHILDEKIRKADLSMYFYKEIQEIIKILIAKGADPTIPNAKGENFLHLLVKRGRVSFAKTLFNEVPERIRKKLLSGRDNKGRVPLEQALYYEKKDFLRFLLQHEESLYLKNEKGEYLFHVIAKEGNARNLEPFLEAGLDPNKSYLKEPPLLLILVERAIKKDKTQVAQFERSIINGGIKALLKHGANPKLKNKDGDFPLHILAREERSAYIRALLEGVSPEDKKKILSAKDADKKTPLELAVQHDMRENIIILIKHGADPYTKNEKGEYLFRVIAREGNARNLEPFFKAGMDPDRNKPKESPLLHILVERVIKEDPSTYKSQTFREAIKLLIQAGGDPDIRNASGDNALHVLARKGRFQYIGFFLKLVKAKDKEKLFKSIDGEGRTLLELALFNQKKELLKVLLKNGVDPSVINKKGENALHGFVKEGDLKRARFFLRELKKSDKQNVFEGGDLDKKTPLELALEMEKKDFIRLFFEQGVSLYLRNVKAEYLFHVLAREGNPRYLEFFFKAGVDPNAPDRQGNTLLEILVKRVNKGDVSQELKDSLREGIKLALRYNADSSHLTKEFETPQMISLMSETEPTKKSKGSKKIPIPEIIKKVESKESVEKLRLFNLDVKDNKGRFALQILAQKGDTEGIERLFRAGASLTTTNSQGNNALHVAALYERKKVIELLVKLGLDVNAKNNKGETALHLASLNSELESVKNLIKLGANPSLKDLEGNFPLHRASLYNEKRVIELLITEESLNAKNKEGLVPLHMAITQGRLDIIEFLIEEKKANTSIKDAKGRTLLKFARDLIKTQRSTQTMKYIVEYLRKKEAEIKCKRSVKKPKKKGK